MKTALSLTIVSTLTFVSALQASASGSNTLTSMDLIGAGSGQAKVCAPVEVFASNSMFRSLQRPGYIIDINGDNSMLDGQKGTICLSGSYVINSKGFAPHIIISATHVVGAEAPAVSSSLGAKISEIATQWNDNNISTGTTKLSLIEGQKSISLDQLNSMAVATLKKKLAKDASTLSVIDSKAAKFHSQNLDFTVQVLAIGNAYADENSEDTATLKDDVKEVVQSLGDENDILTAVASATFKQDGETLQVYTILFANPLTGNIAQIFVTEGSM